MKKKLYRLTYAPGMLINDHMNSFNKILVDLLNLDEKFKDEDKTFCCWIPFLINIIISLPLCFMGRTMSHLMLYSVHCTTLIPERKTKRIAEIQLQMYWQHEVIKKATNLEKEASLKGDLPKMNVLFVVRKGIGKKIVLSYKRARLLLMHV